MREIVSLDAGQKLDGHPRRRFPPPHQIEQLPGNGRRAIHLAELLASRTRDGASR
jgi:hypothetical protein